MELLLQLLIALTGQLGPLSALIAKMQSEGRTQATPEEWATVTAAYAAARADALIAQAEAKAEGR